MDVSEGYKIAKRYIKYFFQREKSRGQAHCRALLVKARIIAHEGRVANLKGEAAVANLLEALKNVTKVINII